MVADNRKFMDDRESLRALVEFLTPPELSQYDSFMALGMESGFPGRRLVVYRLQGGRPEDIEVLTLGAMRMSAQAGPALDVTSDKHKLGITVGVVPVKVSGRDLYLHVPQKFELKWKGKRATDGGAVHFAPHYAVLIKSRSKPHLMVDGDTYCVRFNQFKEMFPDVNVGY